LCYDSVSGRKQQGSAENSRVWQRMRTAGFGRGRKQQATVGLVLALSGGDFMDERRNIKK